MHTILGAKPKKVHPFEQPEEGRQAAEEHEHAHHDHHNERTSDVLPQDKTVQDALLKETIRPAHLQKLPTVWRLMRETGFFNYFVVSNTFLQMKKMIGKEAKDVCKSTWTTMGIVSALLTSVSLGPLSSALTSVISTYDGPTDYWQGDWRRCVLYLTVLSFLCNISVVLITVLLYILIDHCFTEDHMELFLLDWIGIIVLTPAIFTVGVALTIVTVIASIAVTASDVDFWILLSVVLAFFVLLSFVATGLVFYVGRGACLGALDKYHLEKDQMTWKEWKDARKKEKRDK